MHRVVMIRSLGPARTARGRGGFALIAVLVVMGGAMFIIAALLHVLHADAAQSAGLRSADQSRALMRSGLAVALDEMNRQRHEILDGRSPHVESQYIIFEGEDRLGVIRFLPVGADGALLASEAGKIDLNHADAASLEATGLLDAETAAAVIALRGSLGRPFQSVAELLAVEGMTVEMLYGPLQAIRVLDEARNEPDGAYGANAAALDPAQQPALADVFTVFAFEPALQRSGRLRINLNVEWSDQLRNRLADRFNDELADGVRSIIEGDATRFASDSKFFELLMFFAPDDPAEWIEYVDAFSFNHHDYLAGRLDVNTAPYAALKSLATVTDEQAAAIVAARDGMRGEDRATILWPAIEGIVEPRQYIDIGGRVTNRCWNWRVRIAAGTVDAADPDGPMERPLVYEAVIDLSAPKPRIAYLRDITQLQAAAFLAVSTPEPDDRFAWLDEVEIDPDAESSEIADFASDNLRSDDDGGWGRPRPQPSESRIDRSGSRRGEPAGEAAAAEAEDRPRTPPPPSRVGRWKPGG